MKNMKALAGPYHKRRATFIELWPHEQWRVKVYGLTRHGRPPPDDLVTQAKATAANQLSRASVDDVTRVAVLTIHEGENGDYVLIDHWQGDFIHHHNYGAPKGHGGEFALHWPGPCVCLWELAIILFEHHAWREHIGRRASEPDVEGYLAARLTADV